ncbi:hypothetical protein, partial [Nitrobacter sp.]|uniref:hypothetical protein n=1 Tax=Nitrobacter sp. TaxID=29420 RepID=UPI0029CABF2E
MPGFMPGIHVCVKKCVTSKSYSQLLIPIGNEKALGSVLNKDSHERGYVIQAFHDLGAWMAKQVYWLSDVEWRRI